MTILTALSIAAGNSRRWGGRNRIAGGAGAGRRFVAKDFITV